MVQNIAFLGKCSVCNRNECVFCCWMVYLININYFVFVVLFLVSISLRMLCLLVLSITEWKMQCGSSTCVDLSIFFFLQYCPFVHIFWSSIIWCTHIWSVILSGCIDHIYHYEMTIFVPFNILSSEIYYVWNYYSNSGIVFNNVSVWYILFH